MTLQETLGAGAVLMTMGAGFAVAQNQLDIRASKPIDPASVAAGAGTTDAATVAKPATTVSTRVSFVHADPLKLNYVGDGRYRSGFVIHNPHCAAEQVAVTLVLLDRNSEPLPVTAAFEVPLAGQTAVKRAGESWEIPPGHVQHVGLKLSTASAAGTPAAPDSLFRATWRALKTEPFEQGDWNGRIPASGMLALAPSTKLTDPNDKTSACKTAPVSATGLRRPLVLEPPLPTALDTGVLSAALALALFTMVVVAIVIFGSKTMQLRGRMGEVSLDFKSSWGANVTLGTAILTTLTSRAVLAHEQYSTSSTAYSILAIVLAALVPLGVALYSLLKPRMATPGGSQAQGYVSMYLLSAAIILWGAFGEILLLGMVFGELSLARVMSPAAAGLLILLTKVLIVALMAYAMMTAYATVKGTSGPAVAGVNPVRPGVNVL